MVGCTPTGSTNFLGKTGASITDLGQILAESVEWRAQAVQTFYRMFWGRGIARNETSFYRNAESAWLAEDFKPHALLKQILLAPEYCAR